MTVSNATFRSPWVAANGTNKVWNYSFFLAQQSHVVIQVRNNTTGVITEFTSDLTLNKTSDVTGTVTYPVSAAAIASGNSVRVVRRVPYTQDVAIGNEGAFDPELHETAFDTLETQIQQVADGTARALQVPDGNIGGVVQPAVAVDRVMASDGANGLKDSGWTITTLAGNVSAAAASAAAALASQIAAAASAAAALVSQNAAATSAGNAATSEANALSYRNTTQGYMNTTQGYRDTTQGYMNSASTYATNSSNSATASATSATNSSNSAVAAANAQAAAEAARDATLAAFDSFDDRYLGAKAADPVTDNDGNPLVAGTLYYKTTGSTGMYIYTGTLWTAAYIDGTGVALLANNLSDLPNKATARTNLSVYSKAEIDAYGFAQAAKATPVDADTLFGSDSAAGNAQVKFTWANIKAGILAYFNGTAKAAPVFADRLWIGDSAASFVPKYSTITQFLASVFNNPIFTGGATVNNSAFQAIGVTGAPAAGTYGMRVISVNNAGAAAFINFEHQGSWSFNFGMDTDNQLKVGGYSLGNNAYRILHENLASGTFTGSYTFTGTNSFNGITVVAGVLSNAVNDGTGAGTYTPNPNTGNYRQITNNAAFTFAAPSIAGAYNMEIDITNGAAAGAITWSGFITGYPKGDVLTTTNGSKFKVHISKTPAGVTAVVEALQ